jgi:hypothetical protein
MKGAGTMNVKIKMILTDDDHTEEGREIQVEIQESIPGDLQNLDEWEHNVHRIGIKSMQELFKSGIELRENKVLSEYTHKRKRGNNPCHAVRCGFRSFTLRTVFVTEKGFLVIVKKFRHVYALATLRNNVAVSISWASILKLSSLRNGKRFSLDQRVCTPNSGSMRRRRDNKKRPHRV